MTLPESVTPKANGGAEIPAAKVPTLQTRLCCALPNLKAEDFAYHATDLYVVATPEVRQWLKTHYTFWANVTTFRSQEGSGWNGAGKLCFDIPFAGQWGGNY